MDGKSVLIFEGKVSRQCSVDGVNVPMSVADKLLALAFAKARTVGPMTVTGKGRKFLKDVDVWEQQVPVSAAPVPTGRPVDLLTAEQNRDRLRKFRI